MMSANIRIDKWLWSVRIYKTRSQASEACRKGRIFINDEPVKASKVVQIEDLIRVHKPPVIFTYKVKGLLGKRVSPKLVVNYLEDQTPEEEIQKLRRPKFPDFGFRLRGTGRPTKKERRIIDRYRDDTD